MPRLQALYTGLKSKGLGAIALTLAGNYDRAKRYFYDRGEQYFRDSQYTYAAARISPEFSLKNHFSRARNPICAMTTFVVDADRRIVFRDHNTDYADLRAALSKLGIK